MVLEVDWLEDGNGVVRIGWYVEEGGGEKVLK